MHNLSPLCKFLVYKHLLTTNRQCQRQPAGGRQLQWRKVYISLKCDIFF
jgi:hypothetical protein